MVATSLRSGIGKQMACALVGETLQFIVLRLRQKSILVGMDCRQDPGSTGVVLLPVSVQCGWCQARVTVHDSPPLHKPHEHARFSLPQTSGECVSEPDLPARALGWHAAVCGPVASAPWTGSLPGVGVVTRSWGARWPCRLWPAPQCRHRFPTARGGCPAGRAVVHAAGRRAAGPPWRDADLHRRGGVGGEVACWREGHSSCCG